MTDNLTVAQRSHTMRQVKGRNTRPELLVRRLCRDLGETGYRLHDAGLPGRPDIVFSRKRLVVFVNGCFWHGHACAAGQKKVAKNAEYWNNKIGSNMWRDANAIVQLRESGWDSLVLWECQIADQEATKKRLRQFLTRL